MAVNVAELCQGIEDAAKIVALLRILIPAPEGEPAFWVDLQRHVYDPDDPRNDLEPEE
jgi:hypothetical protein